MFDNDDHNSTHKPRYFDLYHTVTEQTFIDLWSLFFFLFCRQLRDGSLDDNQLMQGSRLTLLPSVETGLLVSKSSFSSLLSRASLPLPLDDKPV